MQGYKLDAFQKGLYDLLGWITQQPFLISREELRSRLDELMLDMPQGSFQGCVRASVMHRLDELANRDVPALPKPVVWDMAFNCATRLLPDE